MTLQVIAVPGGVNPAALRYEHLARTLGPEVQLHLKDLEVYAGDQPPADFSIAMEVDALTRFADSLGLDRFHLLSYSAGGFISLAFAGVHPDRLLSLAMFEPAGVPGVPTEEEARLQAQLRTQLVGLSGGEYMRAFMALQVRPGVVLEPPSGPPPPWMRSRPAGVAALMAAFAVHPFDRALLRDCRFPVLCAHGEQTGIYEEVKVGVLARLLPDVRIRRFRGIHHFVPPDVLYSGEHIAALLEHWRRPEFASSDMRSRVG